LTPITLDRLRRYAVARSLFRPTTLEQALERMGFVQADPIRAPARAQDLTLRHRVEGYRAGDLERRYGELPIEEDYLLVYGFVPRTVQALMHPRTKGGVAAVYRRQWSAARKKRAQLLLDFVRERGAAHPREVDAYFSHGRITNYWGGSSNATTHLLDAMHYRGMLRVVRRDRGIRIYGVHAHGAEPAGEAERRLRIDTLVDVVVRLHAPLVGPVLSGLVRRLRFATPQWYGELGNAWQRARQRLASARVDGVDWYWPAEDDPASFEAPAEVRFLTPFDPVVWDRDRFERLWDWAYRFEAYTPASRRKLGYYALPLLWRDRVIGWGNLSVESGRLKADIGYVRSPPRDRAFRRELDAELDRVSAFLELESSG
jgi:hypothetical protein